MGWKVFKPHNWVAFTVFAWGTVSTLQSTCTSWPGLMTCRIFLGIIEACYGPGVPLYLSYFYPREKLGFRTAIFLSGSALANAYGGVLAYGISQAKGGIGPWRILFIVEGVPTCCLALVAWYFIPDSPQTARFLNERQKEVAVELSMRQPGDRSDHKGLQMKQVLAAFADYRNYLPAIMYFGCNVCFGSLPLFVPTIISEMGAFTTVQANGLSAPPYLLCWIMIITTGWVSDRVGYRGPFVAGAAIIGAIGYILLGTSTTVAVRYFGLFLSTQIFVSVALLLIWVANNNSSDSKRAAGLAILATGGQCGPVLGTNVFPTTDKPYYREGMWVSCGACLIVFVTACIQMLILRASNKRRDREYGKDRDWAHLDTTNSEKMFRYVI